jgi:uncharacterized protein (TIGR02246 family)
MRNATAFVAILFWMLFSPAVKPAYTQDEAGVREAIAALMSAWNVHDMHAFADLFTEDASFVNVNGSWLQTRAQVEESHKIVHASIFKNSRAEITPARISFPKPNLAIVEARWQITGDSRSPQPRDYVMTLVLRNQHGQWGIVAAQNASTEDRSTLGFANLRPGDVAPIPALKPQSSPPTDEDHISAVVSAFDRAWNHRDQSGIAGLFAARADFVDPSAGWVQGNQEIANHILKVEMPALNGPLLNSGIERFVVLYPDIAFAQLRWKWEWSDAPARQTEGMGLRVLQRLGSSWQILAAEDTIIRASGH